MKDDFLVGGDGSDFLYGMGTILLFWSLAGGNDTLDGEEGVTSFGPGRDRTNCLAERDQISWLEMLGTISSMVKPAMISIRRFPVLLHKAGSDVLDGEGDDTLQGGGGEDDLQEVGERPSDWRKWTRHVPALTWVMVPIRSKMMVCKEIDSSLAQASLPNRYVWMSDQQIRWFCAWQ